MLRATPGIAFATSIITLALVAGAAHAAPREASTACRGRSPRKAAHARTTASGAKVAVQPFEGPNNEPLRALIVRIVRGRGFHPVTSLPRFEGTGQYPELARDHRLAAFVTADVEERGHRQSITFLVWNGLTGAILGRWTASAPTAALEQAVDKGFWRHLGPAMLKAEAPEIPVLERAPPLRIDASRADDADPVADRE